MQSQPEKNRIEIKKVKKTLWWLKTAAQGLAVTAITFAPEILQVFPEQTLAFKLALPIGFLVKFLWMKSEYKQDVLPSGMTKVMDKIPDSVTGEKGSTKPSDDSGK